MTPSPWHRSRLFWLGILGLIFLLWAWFLLDGYWLARWTRPLGYIRIGCQPGAIHLTQTTIHVPHPDSPLVIEPILPSEQGFTQETGHIPPADRKYFAWPLSHEVVTSLGGASNYHSRRITLPFWLIVPLYLTAWLTTLHLWQRRKTRFARTSTSPPP